MDHINAKRSLFGNGISNCTVSGDGLVTYCFSL